MSTATTVEAADVEVVDVHEAAAKVIANSVKWSAAAAIVPVPYLDLAALGAVQVKMVRDLANVYGVDANSETLQGVISAMIGSLTPVALSGSLVGPSIKFIPGVGSILGSISVAAFGSAATYAVGKVFVKHFDKGGNISDFSAESIEKDLKGEFDAAKSRSTSK